MKIYGDDIISCMKYSKSKVKLWSAFLKKDSDLLEKKIENMTCEEKFSEMMKRVKEKFLTTKEVRKILGKKVYENFIKNVIDKRFK